MAARLPYVERDQAPPEVQEAYDKAQKAMGRVSNFVKLMANHAKSVPGFLACTLEPSPLKTAIAGGNISCRRPGGVITSLSPGQETTPRGTFTSIGAAGSC